MAAKTKPIKSRPKRGPAKSISSHDIKLVPISEITPNPNNRNTHPEEQLNILSKIIKTDDFRHPLIVSKESGLLVCGHGRLEAAKRAGLKELPVYLQSFSSPEQEYRVAIADNSLHKSSEIDLSGIHKDLGHLDSFDIDLLGFVKFEFEPDPGEDKKDSKNKDPDPCPKCGFVNKIIKL